MAALCRSRASSHFYFAEKGVTEGDGRARRSLGFATDFFPRADPAKIDVGKVLPRFLKHDGCIFREFGRGAQEKPVCPMRSIETCDQHMGKLSLAACGFLQTPSIGFAGKNKIAFFQ